MNADGSALVATAIHGDQQRPLEDRCGANCEASATPGAAQLIPPGPAISALSLAEGGGALAGGTGFGIGVAGGLVGAAVLLRLR